MRCRLLVFLVVGFASFLSLVDLCAGKAHTTIWDVIETVRLALRPCWVMCCGGSEVKEDDASAANLKRIASNTIRSKPKVEVELGDLEERYDDAAASEQASSSKELKHDGANTTQDNTTIKIEVPRSLTFKVEIDDAADATRCSMNATGLDDENIDTKRMSVKTDMSNLFECEQTLMFGEIEVESKSSSDEQEQV